MVVVYMSPYVPSCFKFKYKISSIQDMFSFKVLTHLSVVLCIWGLVQVVLAAEDVVVEEVILPDGARVRETDLSEAMLRRSYIIDGKRFVERIDSRCGVNLTNIPVEAIEPRFIIARPEGDAVLGALTSPDEILATGYDPTEKTTILVHGYVGSYPETSWLVDTRKVFQDYKLLDRYNLIIIDFEKGAQRNYKNAVGNSGIIGSYLANFMMKLMDLGAEPRSMHLIGHSLGSHVSAFAAKRFGGKIGRISALDPAGPCFKDKDVESPEDRLSFNDAVEVDNYHYDDRFLGLPSKLGTYDIYFNGGSKQPGCKEDFKTLTSFLKSILSESENQVKISHMRPVELISQPLADQKCQFVAYECSSYEEFLAGNCDNCGINNEFCKRLGFDFQYNDDGPIELQSEPIRKEMHIASDSFENGPCMNHYSMHVEFEPVESLMLKAKRDGWFVEVELTDETGLTLTTTLSRLDKNEFSGLLLTKKEPNKFVSGRVQIRDNEGKQQDLSRSSKGIHLGLGPSVRLSKLRIQFMSSIDSKVRQSLSSNLCPGSYRRAKVTRSEQKKAPEHLSLVSSILCGANFHKTDSWLELKSCD